MVSPANQVLDTGSGTTTLTAASAGTVTATGTTWPLLPKQSLKIYNVGIAVVPDADDTMKCRDFWIVLLLMDSAQNGIQQVSMLGENFTDPSVMGPSGFIASREADPLIEIVSGMLVAGTSSSNGVSVAFIQLNAAADLLNLDAVNTHVVGLALTALLSFQPRS
jgi:hypothetical protein